MTLLTTFASLLMNRIPAGLKNELVIQSALVGFTGPNAQLQIVRSVTIPWAEIIRGLQQDSTFLHSIKPRRLEELIAEAYTREGYKDVVLTPHSADRGRDVIVSATLAGMGTIKIVDQVKRYKQGNKVTADECGRWLEC
jgi:HJR/Mrr/RecB family endonuclease